MSDNEELEKIKQVLQEHEGRLNKLEEKFVSSPAPQKKKISLREFLNTKKPTGDVQRTLAIGYFLEHYESIESFNTQDLEEGFRKAKEKVPGNINYQTIKGIQYGFMQEAKEKKDDLKAWTLTASGEEYVEKNFKRE
jgi:hypothetical protein